MKPKHPGRLTERAMDLLREVVEYGFGNSSGPNMAGRFETVFAERFGVRNAIAVCNGTATMHCCLAAVGVKPGDEVIVPPLTAAATAFCVLHQGAVPVFADIDRRTFNIDPVSIRERITPLTRAIIPVGLYGLSADLDPIMDVAGKHGLSVIEDNAECFLGRYKGRVAGTTGHLASFSLQASKHITCGDGGVVITDDDDLATAVRRFACFGFRIPEGPGIGVMPKQDRGHPTSLRHDFLGWNYRMSELQAAVALEQAERIDEFLLTTLKEERADVDQPLQGLGVRDWQILHQEVEALLTRLGLQCANPLPQRRANHGQRVSFVVLDQLHDEVERVQQHLRGERLHHLHEVRAQGLHGLAIVLRRGQAPAPGVEHGGVVEPFRAQEGARGLADGLPRLQVRGRTDLHDLDRGFPDRADAGLVGLQSVDEFEDAVLRSAFANKLLNVGFGHLGARGVSVRFVGHRVDWLRVGDGESGPILAK